MGAKYKSLQELRTKKGLLKKEVSEMEDLLTFENTKESLSAFTNGLTDDFLKEERDDEGNRKISLNKESIIKKISTEVKEQVFSRNAVMGFADSAVKGGAMNDFVSLATAAMVGGFAKKSMRSGSWKKRIIGIALIYLAPAVLRFIRRKLEEYQRNRSLSSMEQLI